MRETFTHVKEIFSRAIEIESLEERASYLDVACGEDVSLRREIASLLEAHHGADDFLSDFVPHSDQTRLEDGADGFLETQIGPYLLREKLGEGGMGMVYVAEQFEPVRRKVALKIIKPGMASKQVIARFEAERQALAVLSHPNIARILDAGTTDAGRPYFVMELVPGIPIHKFCDVHQLTVPERLELFIQVCQAVQHSHQKGIIHRDLKPNNVLVEEHDVQAVPKIIDFGIAKALDERVASHTVYTQFAQFMGTPDYMSPEQARLSAGDVDTRSDVYSLGVMLYELLTGALPFKTAGAGHRDLDEIRRQIREDEPLRPSYKLSTLDVNQLSTVSTQRRTDPRELSLSLRRELDWIVMKSIEKDRSRRYESAVALARDVRRYLNGEPVDACPPSTGYRLRKFIAKHRTFVVAASLLFLAILMGSITSLVYARKANTHAAATERTNARLQQLLYATDIGLAQQFWKAGDLRNFHDVLDRYATDDRGNGDDLRGFEWWFLKAMGTVESEVLETTAEQGCLVRFSPDGRYLVLGWTDGSIEVKDAASHDTLMMLEGGGYFVYGCDFHPDGNMLATIGDDGVIRLWDLIKATQIREIPAFDKHGHRVFFSADGQTLASSGESGQVRFWDVATGQSVGTIEGFCDEMHGGVERRLACSPQRNLLAIGDGHGIAALYGFKSHERLRDLQGVDRFAWLRCLRFSADGKFVAGATIDREIRLWRANDGRLINTFQGHHDEIQDLAFLPHGNLLVSSDRGGVIRVWNFHDTARHNSGNELNWPEVFRAHDDRVLSLDFSIDGQQLVTGSRDCSFRIQFRREHGIRQSINVARPRAVKFIDNGNKLLVATVDQLQLWDSKSGNVVTLGNFTEIAESIAVTDDELTAVTWHDHGTMNIWNLKSGTLTDPIPIDGEFREIVKKPEEGNLLLSSGFRENGGALQKIGNLPLPEPIRVLSDYETGWMSPDNRLLVAHQLNELHAIDRLTGKIVKKFIGHTNSVMDIAFSSNGRLMASGGDDRTVRIWDLSDGRLLYTILAHNQRVNTVAFLPDDRTIVSGDEGGKLVFSHVPTGRSLFETRVGDGEVRGLELSPDGRFLAVVHSDSLVLLNLNADRSPADRR